MYTCPKRHELCIYRIVTLVFIELFHRNQKIWKWSFKCWLRDKRTFIFQRYSVMTMRWDETLKLVLRWERYEFLAKAQSLVVEVSASHPTLIGETTFYLLLRKKLEMRFRSVFRLLWFIQTMETEFSGDYAWETYISQFAASFGILSRVK